MEKYEQPEVRELEIPVEKTPDLGPVVMRIPLPVVENDQPTDSVDYDPPGVDGYDPQYDRRKYH